MKNKNAFSLIEMQVSLVVAAILVLTIGAISSISLSSHNRMRKEAELYADIFYGFKLIQNRVRESSVGVSIVGQSNPWTGSRLVINNSTGTNDEAFGLCQYNSSGSNPLCVTSGSNIALVHWPNYTASTTVNAGEVIFSTPFSGSNLALTFSTPDANTIIVNLSGTKDNIPFNLSTTIKRRIE